MENLQRGKRSAFTLEYLWGGVTIPHAFLEQSPPLSADPDDYQLIVKYPCGGNMWVEVHYHKRTPFPSQKDMHSVDDLAAKVIEILDAPPVHMIGTDNGGTPVYIVHQRRIFPFQKEIHVLRTTEAKEWKRELHEQLTEGVRQRVQRDAGMTDMAKTISTLLGDIYGHKTAVVETGRGLPRWHYQGPELFDAEPELSFLSHDI